MLITERKYGMIKIVNIFFSDEPVTVNLPDYDMLTYNTYKNWDEVEGFEKIQTLATIIDLSQGTEGIWGKINRQHKRHIRQAEKNGIKIGVSNKYEEFHKIHKKFLIQKNYAGPLGLNIVSSHFMQKYGILFTAEYEGEIVGGNLFFQDENNALSASIAYQLSENSGDKNKMIFDASCLIHWEAMQHFKNLGVVNYHLGGVNHFTQSFGGDIIPQYNYLKFNSRFYGTIFRIGNLFLRTQEWF